MSKCQKCGGCCSRLIIEITHLDVIREPRLLEHARLLDGNGQLQFESDWEKEYALDTPCGFLTKEGCAIYATRPNVCVAFNAIPGEPAEDEGIPTDEEKCEGFRQITKEMEL